MNPDMNENETRFVGAMTKFVMFNLIIRVWRKEDEIKDEYDNSDISELLKERFGPTGNLASVKTVAKFIISEIPRVTAVEVLEADNHGVVLRTE